MLYVIAHFLRDKTPWLWELVDILNSWLFSIRYWKKKARYFQNPVLLNNVQIPGFRIIPISKIDTNKLVSFFEHQPVDAYIFFKPHGFDVESINKLQCNKSFLGYILQDESNDRIAGYCFNRSFFHGKGFRGRMVDVDYRGKGLGTKMNKILNEIGFGIGLRLYETVSKENIASYRSALSASNVKVIKEMEHNELYLEILPE